MKLIQDPVTGQYRLGEEELSDSSVPGANTTQMYTDAMQDPGVVSKIATAQAANTASDNQAATEEQKALEQQKAAEHTAARKDLDAKKAQLDASEAADKAGVAAPVDAFTNPGAGPQIDPNAFPMPSDFDPATGQQLAQAAPDAVSGGGLAPAAPVAEPEVAAQSQKAAEIVAEATPGVPSDAISEGIERVKEAKAMRAGVDIGRTEDLNEASRDAILEAEVLRNEFQEEARFEQEQREAKREALRSKLQARIESKPVAPSPGVAGILASMMGGLLAPNYGGRNTALEMVMAKMKQETATELKLRQQDISLLQDERTLLNDEDRAARSALANDEVLMERKIQGVAEHLRLEAEKPWVAPERRAQLMENIAQLDLANKERIQGKAEAAEAAEEKRRQHVVDQQTKMDHQQAMLQNRQAAKGIKGSKGKRSGGGSGRGRKNKVHKAAQSSSLYWRANDPDNPRDVSSLTFEQEQKVKDDQVNIGLFDTKSGTSFRGIEVGNSTASKELKESIETYANTRNGIQAVLKQYEIAERANGGTLKVGDFASSPEGAVLSSDITQLMMALKNKFELGVLTGPDVGLIEDAIGGNPTGIQGWIADGTNMNHFLDSLQNMQAQEAAAIEASVRRLGGIPKHVEIALPRNNITKHKMDRAAAEAPPTSEETVGDINSLLRTGDNLAPKLKDLRSQFAAARKPSKGQDSGGIKALAGEAVSVVQNTMRFGTAAQKKEMNRTMTDIYFDYNGKPPVGVAPSNHEELTADIIKNWKDSSNRKTDSVIGKAALAKFKKSPGYKDKVRKAFAKARAGKNPEFGVGDGEKLKDPSARGFSMFPEEEKKSSRPDLAEIKRLSDAKKKREGWGALDETESFGVLDN